MISSKEGYHPVRRLTTYKSQECFIITGSSSFTWSCSHVHSTIVRNSVLQFYAIISAYYVFIGELPEEGNGTPLQYSCLENSMDRGAWWAAVHGVAKNQTGLSDFPFTFHFHALEREMAAHSSVLAWRIPGTGEPGGLPSMGSHRVGHDWSDLAAAAGELLVVDWLLVLTCRDLLCDNHNVTPKVCCWFSSFLLAVLCRRQSSAGSLFLYHFNKATCNYLLISTPSTPFKSFNHPVLHLSCWFLQ